MAIPNGYTRIEANKLYENVEYYIDNTVYPLQDEKYSLYSFGSNYPYLYKELDESAISIVTSDGDILLGRCGQQWEYNFINGKVDGVPLLNMELSESPNWLYVKVSDKKLVPLYEGDEIQDEIVGADVTSNGTYEYVPETGFVATKKVSFNVAVPQLDTSDATATASDMLNGKSGYVKGVKVVGNIPTFTPAQQVTSNGVLATKGKYVSGDINIAVKPTLKEGMVFNKNGIYDTIEGFDGYGSVEVAVPEKDADYKMERVENATGTTVVFRFVSGGGYKVTLSTETHNISDSTALQNTYLSTTKPTSASDYDYEALGDNRLYAKDGSVALTQPETLYATSLWVWGYGYGIDGQSNITDGVGATYLNAKQIDLTKDTTFVLINRAYVSANN